MVSVLRSPGGTSTTRHFMCGCSAVTAKPLKDRYGEALDKASHYGLANFTVIVDVNRLGQRGPTELGWDSRATPLRAEASEPHAVTIDGHDLNEIDHALTAARDATTAPTVILAKTIKGRGFSEIEDREGWHGKALPADMAQRALY